MVDEEIYSLEYTQSWFSLFQHYSWHRTVHVSPASQHDTSGNIVVDSVLVLKRISCDVVKQPLDSDSRQQLCVLLLGCCHPKIFVKLHGGIKVSFPR